jgi:GNAT superfamily N-acetyltransferase
MEILPMALEHVGESAETFEEALEALLVQLALPPQRHDATTAAATGRRVAHLLGTDPDGSWVALDGDRVSGFVQASVRDDCWVLDHLFVRPGLQSRGVGARLLDRAWGYGREASRGVIGATGDPRAIRKYAGLPGFRVLPTVSAFGTIRADGIDHGRASAVRDGGPADLDHAAALDRRLRGGAHGPDLEFLLAEGHELRVVPGRGYAVGSATGLALLAADDEDAAAALLTDALARMTHDEPVQLPRLTAEQHWAVPIALHAGLALRPWGPFVVRGMARPPAPYLPFPSFC